MHKVFENSDISVYFSGSGSKRVILSYSSMGYDFNAGGIPGSDALESLGFDVYGIIAKQNNWYPVNPMQEVAAVLSARLSEYDCVVGYGSSMGAYGAIKHSARLCCDFVLALAPQYSIDPKLVSSWDGRYIRHFRSDLNTGMEINQKDLGGQIVIVADPMFPPDIRHAKIISQFDCVEIIPAFGCEHLVIQPLSSRVILGEFLSALIDEDLAKAKSIYRSARKKSQYYRGTILRYFAERQAKLGNLTAAARTVELATIAYDKKPGVFISASKIHRMRQDYHKALDAALEAQKRDPKSEWLARTVEETRATLLHKSRDEFDLPRDFSSIDD